VLRALALALALGAAVPAWAGGAPAVVTTSTDLKSLVEAVGGDRVAVEAWRPRSTRARWTSSPGSWRSSRQPCCSCASASTTSLARARPARRERPRFRPGGPTTSTSRGVETAPEIARVRTSAASTSTLQQSTTGSTRQRAPDQQAILGLSGGSGQRSGRRSPRIARLPGAPGRRLARGTAALAPLPPARASSSSTTPGRRFARRFGLGVVAAVEPSPGVPPSPAALAALTARMRERGVRLLVAEPSSSASLVAQVAARGGARAVTLVPSVGGDPGAGDYLALFDTNVRRLAEALAAAR
jgi:hypothetical protein